MALNQKKTLRCELVRAKGVLDVDASLESFAELLNQLRLSETISDEDKATIREALDKFLAQNKQPTFPLPTMAQVVCNRYLEVDLNQVEATTEKIKAVIREDQDSYYIGKGKNGGVRIVSRMNAEEKAKWEAHRKAEQEAEQVAEAAGQ